MTLAIDPNFPVIQPMHLAAKENIDHEAAAKANETETAFVQGEGEAGAVDPSDVNQGGYGSCAVLSTVMAIAEQDPERIQNMIQDNGDGTYTVTFQEFDGGFLGLGHLGIGGGWKPVQVTVAGPFDDKAASSDDVGTDGQHEVWPAIIEKAYAQYKGYGYGVYDDGENPGNVQQAILGGDVSRKPTDSYSAEQLAAKLDGGEVVVAMTPESEKFTPEGQAIADQYGVAAGHAYAVDEVVRKGDTYTDPNTGQQAVAQEDMIVLNNPWGHDHVVIPYLAYQQVYTQVDSTSVK